MRDQIIERLREVYDPEISVNVFDLGLIYGIDIDEENHQVEITHTLTSAFCPFADGFMVVTEKTAVAAAGRRPHCKLYCRSYLC